MGDSEEVLAMTNKMENLKNQRIYPFRKDVRISYEIHPPFVVLTYLYHVSFNSSSFFCAEKNQQYLKFKFNPFLNIYPKFVTQRQTHPHHNLTFLLRIFFFDKKKE